MTGEDRPSERYSAELVSREPKWHFLRVVLTLLGIPYARPRPFEAGDLRGGAPTPRFKLLINEKITGRILYGNKLTGATAANEAMRIAETDLEELTIAAFRDKYAIPEG